MNTLTDDDFVSPCGHMNVKIQTLKRLILANKNAFMHKNTTCSAPHCNKSWRALWMCCTCGKFFCGYLDNKHATTHYEQDHHALFYHLTLYDLWCFDCNSYKTTETWRATIKPLISLTKEKLSKLDQSAAKADDNEHRAETRSTSRQVGKLASNKPKLTTLGDAFMHLNGKVSFSHYSVSILQSKNEGGDASLTSTHSLIRSECFAKVPIHSHANTCYLNSILQILAHLPPFAQYFFAMQPIILTVDAGPYTVLLQQFTQTIVALQLVTDAFIPPFSYSIPSLSTQKLNIEALSIALFGFLTGHVLGDLHDAHEIQSALFGLLNDSLQFVQVSRQYVDTNLFSFLTANFTRNRNTIFNIFGRSHSEAALIHLKEHNVLVTTPFIDNTMQIDSHLLLTYFKSQEASYKNLSLPPEPDLGATNYTVSELLKTLTLHQVLDTSFQLAFAHVVYVSPPTTGRIQDISQNAGISQRLAIMYQKCSFFDYFLDNIRFSKHDHLFTSPNLISSTSSLSTYSTKSSSEVFGLPVASHSSTIQQLFKYSSAKPLTLVTHCFRGISQIVRRCNKCDSYRTRYETFVDLFVPFSPEKTFLEEFNSLFTEEVCNGVYCDVCDMEAQSSTRLFLYHCPEVLITLRKRGQYDPLPKPGLPRSQSLNATQTSTHNSQLSALSNFSIAEHLAPDSPHKKYELLMSIDVGSDFKVTAFLRDFISYQMYKKLAQELVVIIYELVLKSTTFLHNSDAIIPVIAVMEYVLRRFKASCMLNSSSYMTEVEVGEFLDLLSRLPVGFNIKTVSPNGIEYFTVLLSTHMFYVFNAIFYVLLLLSHNKLLEVERALSQEIIDAPGIFDFLQRYPIEKQSGRAHLLYLLFTVILLDIQKIFAHFKLAGNYKGHWTVSPEQDDLNIQKDMKCEFKYNIQFSRLLHLYLCLQKECTGKFHSLFADLDIWKAGSVNYELSSFIVHCNGNHYVAYIKNYPHVEPPNLKQALRYESPQKPQQAQANALSAGNVPQQQSSALQIGVSDPIQSKQQVSVGAASTPALMNDLGVPTNTSDSSTTPASSSNGVWYCFNDDKVTRIANPPVGDSSILYFTKVKTPIVEALKGYIWTEICSCVRQPGATEPEWMQKIMSERAECLELLEIMLGSHDLLYTALSSAYMEYDLSAEFVYALHNLHWPSLDGFSGHINKEINHRGLWRVSTILSNTIQPTQLAQKYPIPGYFYYCLSALFDGSLTDFLEGTGHNAYALKLGPDIKLDNKVANERALYEEIMALAATGAYFEEGFLLSMDWIENWGAYLFHDKMRPFILDNSALLDVTATELEPTLQGGLLRDIDYILLNKQLWYKISQYYPTKVGHELPSSLLSIETEANLPCILD